MRIVLAIVFAGLIVAAVPGTAQSAPIPPIPAGTTVQLTDLTDVAWRRCWRDRWGTCIAVTAGVAAGASYDAGNFALKKV